MLRGLQSLFLSRMSDRGHKSRSYKKGYEDAKQRLDSELEERRKQLPELRKHARHRYAVDRRKRKMEELEEDIHDTEYLYDGTDVTVGERGELRYRKEVLDLAKEYEEVTKRNKIERYLAIYSGYRV